MEQDRVQDRLKRWANALVRVPAVFLLEILYRVDLVDVLQAEAEVVKWTFIDISYVATVMKILGYLSAFMAQILSFQQLLNLYAYMFTGVLLIGAHYLSNNYIQMELESGYHGFIFTDVDCSQRWIKFTMAQLCIILSCTQLMSCEKYWTFTAYLLPLILRAASIIPLSELRTVHTFAMAFTTLQLTFFMIKYIFIPYDLAMAGYHTLQEYMEIYGFVSVVLAMYSRLFVPIVYLIFWLILFCIQLYSYFSNKSHPIFNENWVIVLLAAIADCCDTPWSLVGLCYTVSYVAYFILTMCKVYLQGIEGFVNHNMLHRGWTEGITLLLLSLQTGLLEMKRVQRIFLLSIVLFVVFASTVQSMHEITDPILMSLTAAHNRNPIRHLRVLTMCVFLFVFPLYMTYLVCTFFDPEFWLLIIVSSCILTSIQVLASTVTYALFMIDSHRREPWENLDDIVYAIKGFCRILEFLVAISVLLYGGMESFYSEYSMIGAAVIIVHCYFNVWQRAQMGWTSFLSRRDAMRRVSSLPLATQEQLDQHNDVCAICFEELLNARVTPCGHYFHPLCLRKWLYVQNKCPLCHRPIVGVQLNETTPGEENLYNAENLHFEDVVRNVDDVVGNHGER
ncbi:RING finger protein 145-like [Saccoglossus kowalevskii]|uniref:RING finger protein 145-like n=1 Tax=Saccoglossus kowalevskii TaxID=10224 RepID=A0ABM0H1U5_SACKO|nr:PREDICTED: RING finger protein 145-like [Saccoglossus kowalevskii]